MTWGHCVMVSWNMYKPNQWLHISGLQSKSAIDICKLESDASADLEVCVVGCVSRGRSGTSKFKLFPYDKILIENLYVSDSPLPPVLRISCRFVCKKKKKRRHAILKKYSYIVYYKSFMNTTLISLKIHSFTYKL